VADGHVDVAQSRRSNEDEESDIINARSKAQMRAAERLWVLAQQWQATFDAIGSSIALLDREGRVMRHNQAFAQMPSRVLLPPRRLRAPMLSDV
jgi:PAS domain-containing protein